MVICLITNSIIAYGCCYVQLVDLVIDAKDEEEGMDENKNSIKGILGPQRVHS